MCYTFLQSIYILAIRPSSAVFICTWPYKVSRSSQWNVTPSKVLDQKIGFSKFITFEGTASRDIFWGNTKTGNIRQQFEGNKRSDKWRLMLLIIRLRAWWRRCCGLSVVNRKTLYGIPDFWQVRYWSRWRHRRRWGQIRRRTRKGW